MTADAKERRQTKTQKPSGSQPGFWFSYLLISLAEGDFDSAAEAHAQLKELGFHIQLGPSQPQGTYKPGEGGVK